MYESSTQSSLKITSVPSPNPKRAERRDGLQFNLNANAPEPREWLREGEGGGGEVRLLPLGFFLNM